MINIDNYPYVKTLNFIDKGDIIEVIEFAKKENIFVPKINRFQQGLVEKIKQRLDREGLEYDIVRPE